MQFPRRGTVAVTTYDTVLHGHFSYDNVEYLSSGAIATSAGENVSRTLY